MKKYCGGDFLYWIVNAHVYYFTVTTSKNDLRKAGYDFICGNEIIHSIFKPSLNKEGNYKSDYENAMSFLRKMKFYKFVPTLYNVKRLIKPIMIILLKRVGLYNIAKKIYHKFKSQS